MFLNNIQFFLYIIKLICKILITLIYSIFYKIKFDVIKNNKKN